MDRRRPSFVMVTVAILFSVFAASRLVFGNETASSARPKGVRPELASFYDANRKVFSCLDGSNSIPFDQVNDDYCDCKDGSDEPGTSACPNGHFYCSNKGFKPSLLPASRVNDGICDCCDGSDEWALQSDNPCNNNCMELGKAEREEREMLAKVTDEGLQIKQEMIQNGLKLRSQRESDIATKRAEKELLEKEKSEKEEVKLQAEELEKEALDIVRQEEDKLRAEREAEEKVKKDAETMKHFDKMDLNSDGVVAKEELMTEIKLDQNNDGIVSEEEANFYLSGHHSYDKETFLNTGWLLMGHLFTDDPRSNLTHEGEEHLHHDDLDDLDEHKEDYDYDEDEEDVITAPPDTTNDGDANVAETKESKYSPEVQALVDAADNARAEYDRANNLYQNADREVEGLQKSLETDYGGEQEFASLANQCFDLNDHEYTYKMCAFDYCSQRPLSGGSETRLGNWEGWSAGKGYAQMSYQGGVQCWNGPARSTMVDLRCGLTNALISVNEPAKCEYHYVFETPAACQPLPPINHEHDEL